MAAAALPAVSLSLPSAHSACRRRGLLLSTAAVAPPFAGARSLRSSLSLATFPLVLPRESDSTPGMRRGASIVCEAAGGAGQKRPADSAVKRARQAEKRRIYNKARKSEIRTRMRKALEAMDELRKKAGAQSEEIIPVEKLIGEAYSAIDKAVRVGTLHRNTGARRKSRLARRKKDVEVHHGWYVPSPVAVA